MLDTLNTRLLHLYIRMFSTCRLALSIEIDPLSSGKPFAFATFFSKGILFPERRKRIPAGLQHLYNEFNY